MIGTQIHVLLLSLLMVLTLSEDLTHTYLTQIEDTNDLTRESDQLATKDRLHQSLLSRPVSPLLSYLFTKLSPEGPEKQEVIKRVFCNGFTGCGGRYRGRRRQHSTRILKRPFCNNWGCGNGKRALENIPLQPPGDKLIRKRLFCNNYGGCHGGKKRTLYSNWLGDLKGVAANL